MKNLNLIITLTVALLVSGCLEPETTSTTETSVGHTPPNPPDFDVNPNPNSPPPTPMPVPTPPPPPPGDDDVVYGFTINNGAAFTSDTVLNLSIEAPIFIKSIKIGQSADCSDGAVESMKTTTTIPVWQRNAVNRVSVEFIDYDNAPVTCLVKTILQDDQGPTIVINRYPLTTLEEGSTADLYYTVTDASPIQNVRCRLNSLEKPCTAGETEINFTELPVGNYTFTVEATDRRNFTSQQSVSWTVVSTTRSVLQTVEVRDERKVDILIVIDNSGSMEYEQRSMGNRVSNMLSVLNGLDWQIAVTTTDPRNVALGDGRLIPISGLGGGLILNSTMNPQEAQTNLSRTLQRPEVGSGSEQPIYATYRLVERSQGSDPAYRNFFRDGANFATIVISDEDESANTTKNDPQSLINLVSSTFHEQKVFTWHSIITKPGDTACRSTYGAAYGERLKRLSELTGGLIGSVCEADYAAQVTGIATGILNMNKSLALTCDALNQFSIVVKKDGSGYNHSFVREGLNLKFADILEPGTYTIEYRCLR